MIRGIRNAANWCSLWKKLHRPLLDELAEKAGSFCGQAVLVILGLIMFYGFFIVFAALGVCLIG